GYFLVTPQDVNTRAALLTVGGSGNTQATYLAATGVRSVVVARHGPNFAASQGTVISVDGNGNPIPGAGAPSLSANGRFVAFTALDQVWRHDTDRAGDGSGLPGATNLASCLPGPGCQLPVSAGSPSISGDGSSIAFATPPTGSTQGQVYVRRTTTVLESAGGNGSSQTPMLSQDGSTLAFTSFATNLVSPPTISSALNLYLVDLGPGTPGIELVAPNGNSVAAEGTIGEPSLDAHGRVLALTSNTQLLPTAPANVTSTYTFERFGQLQTNPGSVGFGRLVAGLPGQTHTITVTDTGLGPATVTAIGITGGFRLTLNTCLALVLHHGQTCQLTVLFTPIAAGSPTGVLTVTTADDGDPPAGTTIGLSATVVVPTTPVLTLSPTVSYGGQVVHATGVKFPAGTTLTLAWNRGLGVATVVSDANGGFHTDLVIFPDDLLGIRALIATGPTGTMLATVPFLVEANPQEPPFHHP
ncbi:MAG TPA: choice-of-anchor D domain-containing protein, partial [Pseudonocardiaceae bacterium]|nr:choice-of-anchor D domain-containing protein [Pseudonocardiaceae bacterium]